MRAERRTASLIPVKAFSDGKSRLQTAMGDQERADLARELATGVIRACADMNPHVICEDDGIANWAMGLGASVLRPAVSGLNRVVRFGVEAVGRHGYERALVAHADLADADALRAVAELDGVVLVPDTEKSGTNVVVVPARLGFSFSYGPNSFARHLSEAERLGLPVHIVVDEGLALDIDNAADLELYRARRASSARPQGLTV
ncbi:MAG: 2-phospho-L-lactate guanylyltransferase [Acidimicrobiales bacterium]